MALTQDQALLIAILLASIALFLWGRWRHDVVALTALLASVAAGLVPSAEAFTGFAHPAVITVACVLILSNGLQRSGVIDILVRYLPPASTGPLITTSALTGLAMTLSAFMNNVGALALLMPVAIQIAERHQLPPGKVLMPLSFGTILGGMTTLIGTPPNLIVAGFRAQHAGRSFEMFDFTPAGVVVAVVGGAFLILIGWRLVPRREGAGTEGFETGAYLTEARVPPKSKAAGMILHEIEAALEAADARIVGLVRGEIRIPAPSPYREIKANDILLIQAEPGALAAALSTLDLELEEAVSPPEKQEEAESRREEPKRALRSKDVALIELVVLPNSEFAGRSASDIFLRTRFGINMLAVSRQGRRSTARLRDMAIKTGDVLLMQGAPETVRQFALRFGCVPLAERTLYLPNKRRALAATGILLGAVGVVAVGLAPAAIAFAGGVLAAVAFRVTSARTVYRSVDWTVIILLGALIPVAEAMATTGTADLLARLFLDNVARGDAVIALIGILVISMTLSDFMNNAATAAVMCPIAIGAAERLGGSADPFLMAVAVGASCAFLTPIGHQNNTLILGPGGFRFGDYWRLGVPLELIVVAVGTPAILFFWPLSG